jgi:HAD superfamily hydrolase (TIGR01509 family)
MKFDKIAPSVQNPNKAIATVLFDLDGVLADSEMWWDQIDGAMLAEHGIVYNGEHKQQVLGKSFALSLEFYRQTYQLRTDLEEMMLRRRLIAADFYAQHIGLFPSTRDVLDHLRKSGYNIGLATSSVGAIVRPFLDKYELTAYFDAIVTGEQVERGKPFPDIYLKAARGTDTEPARCLVVEDALAGVAAGKSAGARVAAIPDTRFVAVADYIGQADYILNDLGELPGLLKRLVDTTPDKMDIERQ